MTSSISISPPNSLLVVTGGATDSIPESIKPGEGFASTPSAIAIACLMDQDGETNVTLGPVPKGTSRPVYTALLETPNHYVAVWTIEWERLLEARVPTTRTKIQVWTNHPTEPNEVVIGIGE
jgi:hypothetical protein